MDLRLVCDSSDKSSQLSITTGNKSDLRSAKALLKTGLTEPWSDIVFVKEAISLATLATLASLSISFNLQVSASSFINVLKLFINVSVQT